MKSRQKWFFTAVTLTLLSTGGLLLLLLLLLLQRGAPVQAVAVQCGPQIVRWWPWFGLGLWLRLNHHTKSTSRDCCYGRASIGISICRLCHGAAHL